MGNNKGTNIGQLSQEELQVQEKLFFDYSNLYKLRQLELFIHTSGILLWSLVSKIKYQSTILNIWK